MMIDNSGIDCESCLLPLLRLLLIGVGLFLWNSDYFFHCRNQYSDYYG